MTTETKFTPGPWQLDIVPDDFDDESDAPEERFEIRMGDAIENRRRHSTNHLIEIDWSLAPGKKQYEEALATVNLIAAAPDLYAALDGMLAVIATGEESTDLFFDGAQGTDARIAAETALARARGES